MLLFYLPLAAVVTYLNRLMPLEGGLYQWAKSGFGEMAGFLSAWNLWTYAVVDMGAILFVIPTDLGYIFGARGAWIPGSKPGNCHAVAVLSVSICVHPWPKPILDLFNELATRDTSDRSIEFLRRRHSPRSRPQSP